MVGHYIWISLKTIQNHSKHQHLYKPIIFWVHVEYHDKNPSSNPSVFPSNFHLPPHPWRLLPSQELHISFSSFALGIIEAGTWEDPNDLSELHHTWRARGPGETAGKFLGGLSPGVSHGFFRWVFCCLIPCINGFITDLLPGYLT